MADKPDSSSTNAVPGAEKLAPDGWTDELVARLLAAASLRRMVGPRRVGLTPNNQYRPRPGAHGGAGPRKHKVEGYRR